MTTIFHKTGAAGFCITALCVALLATGCDSLREKPATPAAPATSSQPSSSTPPAAPPPTQAYDKAVLSAATALFKNAKLPAEGMPAQAKYAVVIDPLIDGMTGTQSVATQAMGLRLANMMREQYPQFDVKAFSAANVARSPLVLIGTFTGVNAERKTAGPREAYRICLALADLRSGKLVSKGLAFALPDGVDPTPLAFFRDAPAWSEDPATEGYIKTCQGTKAGDPINPLYLDRIIAASLVAEAIAAYDAGRYQEALELYGNALATPAGNQFRVHNGIYLAHWKLGHRQQAAAAFGKIVDYGLEHRRLAVKFLFRPGSTAFVNDPKLSGPYPVWLKTIAQRTSGAGSCLEVTGHTSPTGPEPLNERLSLLRAEFVKARLEGAAPKLAKRMIANGVGSRQTMVGNGRDDASDALDRRVEFKVIGC
ncbi:OmpA family protein [Ferribacterium limneticum]|uniref:OmpA family protein n=1 Tax=Ferribacterium limneticum TaxID=76259 RepID=UPI001CF8E9AA|nr:OmpA family protein [Ferribacterium limneticum]UCV21676.1 OmpA family protein [Ferribacterium limneticum]